MRENMLRSHRRRVDPFVTGAAWFALLGCLVTTVVPPVLTDVAAFRGSLAVSGLVSLAFAGQTVRSLTASGRPELPASAVTTVFGLWFVVAPLRYGEPGLYATAAAQAAGVLVAAFAGYLTLAGLVGDRDDH